GVPDPRRVEELLDRVVRAVPVERIGVVVTDDHEPFPRGKSTTTARVVVDVVTPAGGHVVGPETDLVVITGSVAVLRSVVGGRSRMRGEHVDDTLSDADGNVPLGLRGQPQCLQYLG